MQILDGILIFSPYSLSLSPPEHCSLASVASLPFNPIKLLCLVLWVYSGLYFIQQVQFSPLVPKKYKSAVYVVNFLAGPILCLLLVIIDTARKSCGDGRSFLESLRQQTRRAFGRIRTSGAVRRRPNSAIRLLDSSGRSINEIYGHGDGKRQEKHVLDLTEEVIANALAQRASDILVDPVADSQYTIRLRVDGTLKTVQTLEAETCKAIVNSIKAVSSMDISEKRRPQDGAFAAKTDKATASFRVASAGVLNGEKLSIRILNQDAGKHTLLDIGLTKKQYPTVKRATSQPAGMVLVCGPTGSGKTTTMYAMLNQIDRFTHNVITVEDPVEALLPQASQIEINPKAGITFAKALRSVLRQDPDVICVGEIRDEETAEIALRASQTGHLVFATIHCHSNATALVRLLDLGISPLLMSSGLSLLVSQRLFRTLCNRCKRPARLREDLIGEFQKRGIDHHGVCEPVGCRYCDGTGYFGRTAIFDLMDVTGRLKTDMAGRTTFFDQLKDKGQKKDRVNLRKEGLKRVALGTTSLEELKRVVG
jgi:general secretion pathway protein E